MDEFILVLGEENNILPGRLWSGYKVKVLDDKMICTPNKEKTLNYEIYFKDFKKLYSESAMPIYGCNVKLYMDQLSFVHQEEIGNQRQAKK